jgi:hypothetical protein
MSLRIPVACTVLASLFFAAGLKADSISGITWQAPAGWSAQPQRPMRAASYTIPAAAGDSEGGECIVYYFGPGQGGGVEANVQRWIGQFEAPGGGPADKLAKRSPKTVNGIAMTQLDLSGTYLFKPFPMAPQATKKPGYRMIAAIVQGKDAPVFFKLTAPAKTAAQAEAAFNRMIESMSKQ